MKNRLNAIKGLIQTERFEIPYRIYDNAGPQVICLNGVQQSMAMWHSFIARFASTYRVVLFDFPGQGKAKFLSGPKFVSLDEQIDILERIVKETKISQHGTIVSASWGGIVAMAFAARHPGAIKKLCLAGLGSKANNRMIETIQKGFKINPNDRQKMAETLIDSFGQDLPDHVKKKIFDQFRVMTDDNLRSFCEQGEFVMATQKIGTLIDLSKITAKTILIHGEKDKIIDLEDVEHLASQIPRCEIRIIKDAGHFMHLEREDLFDIYHEILEIPAGT